MGFIKGNLMPLAVGVAIGIWGVPFVMNLVKNR